GVVPDRTRFLAEAVEQRRRIGRATSPQSRNTGDSLMNRRNPRPFRAGAVLVLLLALALGGAGSAAAQTPLGATLGTGGVQFPVFSPTATRMEVWISAPATASTPTARYTLTQTDTTNHIWTVTVSGLGAGTLYGYRAWGPNWPYNASWTAGSN